MKNHLLIFLLVLIIIFIGYANYGEFIPKPSISPKNPLNPEQPVECKIGEDCNREVPRLCDEGFTFSQRDCECVLDSSGCEGLEEEVCEQNTNCFSFSRSGTCNCPTCEIYLVHQCLPN